MGLSSTETWRSLISSTLAIDELAFYELGGNRILFEDGLPIAVLEKDEVKLLRASDSEKQWQVQQLLQRRYFPPRLRAYLGKQ